MWLRNYNEIEITEKIVKNYKILLIEIKKTHFAADGKGLDWVVRVRPTCNVSAVLDGRHELIVQSPLNVGQPHKDHILFFLWKSCLQDCMTSPESSLIKLTLINANTSHRESVAYFILHQHKCTKIKINRLKVVYLHSIRPTNL